MIGASNQGWFVFTGIEGRLTLLNLKKIKSRLAVPVTWRCTPSSRVDNRGSTT
ncbi:Uncharacterised protein [Vibrio cholerae]|nr:Uncharacterised protein [Vibrio cholerae]